MVLIPFSQLFEEQANTGTRNLLISGHTYVPDGFYELDEFFCAEPGCTCDLFILAVNIEEEPDSLGLLAYAFSQEGRTPKLVSETLTAAGYHPGIVEMVSSHLQEDDKYVQRLKKHRDLVRQVVNDPEHPLYPNYQQWYSLIKDAGTISIISATPTGSKPKRASQKQKDPYKVPQAMQDRYNQITALTDAFCREQLDEEYSDVCHKITAALARKRPSPLVSGKINTWAAGIVYAAGQMNFLFDVSQTPHIRADSIGPAFGLAASTAGNKAKQIRDVLKISIFSPEFTIPSLQESSPFSMLRNLLSGDL
jgi:hypothetical protein